MGDPFPESWVSTLLEGSEAFRDVDYFEQIEDEEHHKWKCCLCGTGWLRSTKSCLEHTRGRQHQRRYAALRTQQRIWLQEQSIPDSFTIDDDDTNLPYLMPFRRWQFNVGWVRGESCRLCGTGEMSTRLDVVKHFESKRHVLLRNNNLWEHHPECQAIRERVDQLPSPYRYRMVCALYRYLGVKEASYAALASQKYAFFGAMKTLMWFELRAKLAILECAIWKATMLTSIEQGPPLKTLTELEVSLRSKGVDVPEFRRECRRASHVNAIIVGVIPFLKEDPWPSS
jgi:hypothetical protein